MWQWSKNKLANYSQEDKDNYLVVKHLTKQYKKNMAPAIDDLNFKVGPGEFHAFIGGNGAGKTTTIKCLVGAYAKYKGQVYFSGYINSSLNAKKTIGYIPELARFPENTSTYHYLLNMALLSEISKKEAQNLINDILVNLHMQNLAKKSPNTFSSGQKKKILLAQALLHDPKILIMDEPTANLDPKSRIEFFEILKKLQHQGKSIFISSHILNEVDKYASHATILDGGHIVFSQNLETYRQTCQDEIIIKTETLKKCLSFLDKKHLKYKINDNDEVVIYKKKNIVTNQLLKQLIDNNIKIISFKYNTLSLEDIYNKFVIKGSVHTMEQ